VYVRTYVPPEVRHVLLPRHVLHLLQLLLVVLQLHAGTHADMFFITIIDLLYSTSTVYKLSSAHQQYQADTIVLYL
jgi:hypothetical protein